LAQEGRAGVFAGSLRPALDTDDLAYSRVLLDPLQDTPTFDRATVIAALFGDATARRLGHAPLGLSDRAGLAVALADARESGQEPEKALISGA
jgi:hypothetical protein